MIMPCTEFYDPAAHDVGSLLTRAFVCLVQNDRIRPPVRLWLGEAPPRSGMERSLPEPPPPMPRSVYRLAIFQTRYQIVN